MNKKLKPLICIALIIIISIPVISIAFAGKPDKGPIEKKVFIHRAKPDKPDKPSKPDGNDKEWYKYSGIHWTSLPVKYIVDKELNLDVIEISFKTWDDETSTELFFEGAPGEVTAGFLDDTNALSYGDYSTSGVIAVTYIWYWRDSGEIVEVDTLFDTDYEWSLSGEPDKMDLQNIATHEFGHWLVLDDLYNRPAREQTMYGYSTEGETIKRTLDSGDIAGLEAIYGE